MTSLVDQVTFAYYQRNHDEVRRLVGLADARLRRIATLFDAVAHGGNQHRAWLKAAIEAHFCGKPIPSEDLFDAVKEPGVAGGVASQAGVAA